MLQLGGLIVLARLLDPSDYGLLAMVLAVVGLTELLRDFGLSSAAVQARTLSIEQRNNLFWINAVVGTALAGVVVLISPLVALLYDEPRLGPMAAALAVTFAFNGFATQFRANMNRALRFGSVAVADVGAQAAGLAVGIAMALSSFGYWALVGQQITVALTGLVLLVSLGRWRPGRYRRRVPMRQLLGFGSNFLAAQLLGYASKNADSVVLGITLGAAPLGLYNRAYQLSMLPVTQVNAPATQVALGVLSRIQDDRKRFDEYLLVGQTVLLHAVLAIFSVACGLAAPLITLALGVQWVDAIPVFQILCIAGVFHTAGYATYWVFLAKGLTRSHFHWELISRPLLVLVIVLAAPSGLIGLASAYTAAVVVMWACGLLWIRRVGKAPAGAMFTNALRAMVVYGCAGAAAYASATLAPSGALLLAILFGIAGWFVATAVLFAVWPALRRDLRVLLRVASLLRSDRRLSPAQNGPTR
jgi:PST family polysaccharide transporter